MKSCLESEPVAILPRVFRGETRINDSHGSLIVTIDPPHDLFVYVVISE